MKVETKKKESKMAQKTIKKRQYLYCESYKIPKTLASTTSRYDVSTRSYIQCIEYEQTKLKNQTKPNKRPEDEETLFE